MPNTTIKVGIMEYACLLEFNLFTSKATINIIEKLCRNIPWSGRSNSKNSKIAWDIVTRNRQEGGLKFKDIDTWNRHLWDLIVMKSSIWLTWIIDIKLKELSF